VWGEPEEVRTLSNELATVSQANVESWEDHIEAWHAVMRGVESSQWALGQIAASVDRTYGTGGIEKFAVEVAAVPSTVWRYAQVWTRFGENSLRSENPTLTWFHYRIVAPLDDAEAWLARAADEGWSVRQLRTEIKRARQLSGGIETADRFATIVIDPPWPMDKIDRDVRPKQGAMDYPAMAITELVELDIPALDNAHLYLWTTHKHLPNALQLTELWGFTYQCLLTWIKNVGFTPFSWMYSTEHVIFARRGSLDLEVKGRRLEFMAKVREHSRKPDEFYQLVREVSPGPRADIFSRETREGFTPLGNEVGKFDVA
jgi:N6-adenosine-specific RNA methylase IME4